MISIIAIGKIKEDFFEDAIKEYLKRLSAYVKVKIIELQDEKCPESLSDKQQEIVKRKEGERILSAIKRNDYVITLEIKGNMTDSEGFSKIISNLEVTGQSNIVFVIGGSLGLSQEVSKRADMKISFSEMTFPHQLMRVILLEQIYRAYKILRCEPYHK